MDWCFGRLVRIAKLKYGGGGRSLPGALVELLITNVVPHACQEQTDSFRHGARQPYVQVRPDSQLLD